MWGEKGPWSGREEKDARGGRGEGIKGEGNLSRKEGIRTRKGAWSEGTDTWDLCGSSGNRPCV